MGPRLESASKKKKKYLQHTGPFCQYLKQKFRYSFFCWIWTPQKEKGKFKFTALSYTLWGNSKGKYQYLLDRHTKLKIKNLGKLPAARHNDAK